MKEWRSLASNTQYSLSVTAFLAFSAILGIDIHTPSLPSMVDFFHTTPDPLQMAVTLFILGASLGIVMWGPLSDNYGRKSILVTGALLIIISAIMTVFVTDIRIFLLLRFLQGVGSGAPMCLCRVIAADVLDKKQLAVIGSTIGLITGMAPMLAPVIGGYVEETVGWQGSFVIYATITSFALLLFVNLYSETTTNRSGNLRIFSLYRSLFRQTRFVCLGLLQGTVLSVINCYAVVAPFLVQVEMGFSPVFFGWLSFYCAICQLLTKILAPVFIRHYSAYRLHVLGWCVLLLSASGLLARFVWMPDNELSFIISIGMAFCSIHMIIPYLFSEAMSLSHASKGILGAGFSSTGMLFSFILSSIIAWIPYEGSGLLGIYYVFLGIMGLLFLKSPWMRHNIAI